MALYFSNLGDKSKIQQAVDYMQEAMRQILAEETELNKVALGNERKVMKINSCNQMGKVYSGIDSYSSNGYYHKLNCQATCEKALAHAAQLWEETERLHQENIPAIENNKQLVEAVRLFMTKIGIPETYSIYEYKSNRSRTRSEVTHVAGWKQDISRSIQTDDGYSTAREQYEYFLKRVADYKKAHEEKERQEQAEKAKKERIERESKELAALVVKYQLSYDSNWDDVRNAILSKNKYLRLAYYLEQQRNDWSDGFYKAETGLEYFDVESELDQKIYDNISGILETVEDGREFRDCEYNYSVLYGMVEDEGLYNDLRLVLQHEEMSY